MCRTSVRPRVKTIDRHIRNYRCIRGVVLRTLRFALQNKFVFHLVAARKRGVSHTSHRRALYPRAGVYGTRHFIRRSIGAEAAKISRCFSRETGCSTSRKGKQRSIRTSQAKSLAEWPMVCKVKVTCFAGKQDEGHPRIHVMISNSRDARDWLG